MRTVYYFLFLSAFLVSFFLQGNSYYHLTVHNKNPKDSVVTVNINFTGDLMCHSVQYNYARVNTDSFDFKPVYKFVKSLLEDADITLGNLETVVNGKKDYSGYPRFNSPEEYIEALKDAGFDLLFTSNNHSFDRDELGVTSTNQKIFKYNLLKCGTYLSREERDSSLILDIKGVRLGFGSYSYGLNGNSLPKNKEYLVNLIDTSAIKIDVRKLRAEGAEIIIIYFHFGEEYKTEPSDFQKEIVNLTIGYGADIVLGSHPHVLQPIDVFENTGGLLDSGFAAYSLGNFVSNQRWRYSDGGAILNFSIEKNIAQNKLKLKNCSYIPVWVFKGKFENKNHYFLVPSGYYETEDSVYSFLTPEDRRLMKQHFSDSNEILTRHSDRFKVRSLIDNRITAADSSDNLFLKQKKLID